MPHLLLTWPVRAVDEAVIGVVTVASTLAFLAWRHATPLSLRRGRHRQARLRRAGNVRSLLPLSGTDERHANERGSRQQGVITDQIAPCQTAAARRTRRECEGRDATRQRRAQPRPRTPAAEASWSGEKFRLRNFWPRLARVPHALTPCRFYCPSSPTTPCSSGSRGAIRINGRSG